MKTFPANEAAPPLCLPALIGWKDDVKVPSLGSQSDSDQVVRARGIRGGLDCSGLPSATRQEFAADTDVNRILARQGVNIDGAKPVFGEHDFSLTLQDAIHASRDMSQALQRLPAAVRARYKTWPEIFSAVERGEIHWGEKPLTPEEQREDALLSASEREERRERAHARAKARAKAELERMAGGPFVPPKGS